MSICSDDMLELAKDLLVDDSESRVRASVGRSYYALYHEALEVADKLQLASLPADRTKATHERLISRYEQAGKRLAFFGRTLRKQKKLRALADYDIRDEMSASEAWQHIEISKRLIGDLRRIEPRP